MQLSQPEDSCTHNARQRVLILLMLTVELPSRLLSLSVAPNSMINALPHFCSAPEPEACPLSMGIIRETHIHLKRAGVQQDVAEELPQNIFRLRRVHCTCLRLSSWMGVVPPHPYLATPHAGFLTQAEMQTHAHTNAGLTTLKVNLW